MEDRVEAIEQTMEAIDQTLRRLIEAVGVGVGDGEDRPTTYELSQENLRTLAEKLDDFGEQLEDNEKATLLSVLGAAAVKLQEVGQEGQENVALIEGIEVVSQGPLDRVSLGDALIGLGNFDRGPAAVLPGDAVADSVNVGGDVTCVHGDWTKDLAAVDLADRASWTARPELDAGVLGRAGGLGGGFERVAPEQRTKRVAPEPEQRTQQRRGGKKT